MFIKLKSNAKDAVFCRGGVIAIFSMKQLICRAKIRPNDIAGEKSRDECYMRKWYGLVKITGAANR
jgi:hypothetical protein